MSAGTSFGEVRRFAELDSTNRYLLDEARAGAPAGLVVVAGHQTAGRGRLGRRWEAPAGANLLVSVLLRPRLAVEELHLCSVVMALAARTACARTADVEARLKWPNDLLVGEKKIGGILAESVADSVADGAGPPTKSGPARRAVVVGLGLNVAWPAPEGQPGLVPPTVPADEGTAPTGGLGAASSLWRESVRRPEPAELLTVLLAELDLRLGELESAEGRRRLVAEYRGCCESLGRQVMVILPGERLTGSVVDISVEGHLLVDVGVCIRTITAGDIVHLRAGP
ncbi:MAG TPA: biotin--[acetyl-CoA-carboxylase] ligase [Acidimicrobiales bacterium]|nr:biotin--[acetyl-CoA-carboxylase] ligase [Acidimicrobiales bacterium]